MKKLLSFIMAVAFCAILAVPAFALDVTEVKSASDPLSEAPAMKHVQKVGPVTFSNYVSHTEDEGYDANDKPISGYIVTIGTDGCMKTDEANSDFIWYVLEFNFDGTEDTKYSVKTDEVYVPVPGSFNTLNVWDIETFADGRAEDGTWPGGIVWQFKEDKTNGSDDGVYKDVKRIKAVINGEEYYYIVRVVNTEVFADTPVSQIPKEPAKTPVTWKFVKSKTD